MAYWVGIAFLAVALWFVRSAIRHRQRAELKLRRMADAGVEPKDLHQSLSILADVAPALVTLFLFAAGALTVVAFFVTRVHHSLSLFDLAAYVGALAAYGFWLNTRTTYRVLEA